MKKQIAIIYVLVSSSLLYGQRQLTLSQCQQMAVDANPLNAVLKITENSNQLTSDIFKYAFYPRISINGRASYQSDVTKVDLSIPGVDVPIPDNDQYRVSLEMQQPIYDGGNVKAQKELAINNIFLQTKQAEIGLQLLKENVNHLYESILMVQTNLKLLDIAKNTLSSKKKRIRSAIQNGVLTSETGDALEAEILKLEQQYLSATNKRKALIAQLSRIIGESLSDDTELIPPGMMVSDDFILDKRPEIAGYDLQLNKCIAELKQVESGTLPHLTAFVQGGYGRPGLNMLDDNFQTFYMAGLQFSWNISAFYTLKKEKKLYSLKQEVIGKQKEALELSLTNDMIGLAGDISKLEAMISKDNDIIRLRKRIADNNNTKLEEGIITFSEYINAMNELRTANQNRENHIIQLNMKKAEWLIKQGLTIE